MVLGWSNDELLRLVHSALKICMNPTVGKGMCRKELREKLCKQIVDVQLRLSDACSEDISKNHRDMIIWMYEQPRHAIINGLLYGRAVQIFITLKRRIK